jgi:tetratricopeptide (TPR) repeat protein
MAMDPSMMDPSTEFGSMMQTAMKIKGHQMEQDRRRFETWPQFFQNSLWMQGPALELRLLPPAERLAGATSLKEAGNELFKLKKWGQAVDQYEQALGSFKWAKQLDPDWKKKGIKDETIEVVEEYGEGETREAVVPLLVSCYNNLAACYLGRARSGSVHEPGCTIEEDCALCIQACDAAIEAQPGCVKALYRRACARIEPVSSGASAVDDAIKDLAEATRHSPEDKAVRTLLAKLRQQRASQRKEAKATYSGLFGRGEIYDERSVRAQREREQAEAQRAKAAEAPRTAEDCEREAKEAEAMVAHLREGGKLAEAAQLEAKIGEHRRQLERFREARDEPARGGRLDPRAIDFRNPSEEQLRDAKKHGIDLKDPMVLAELERLQAEADAEEGGEGGEGGRGTSEPRAVRRRRRPPPPDVHGMPLWEIKRRHGDLGEI